MCMCPREHLQKTHANRKSTSKSRNIFISLTAGTANAHDTNIYRIVFVAHVVKYMTLFSLFAGVFFYY